MSGPSSSTSPDNAGLDLDPAAWPTDWRGGWQLKEADGEPRLWHRSGLCFFFEFEQTDAQGSWSWVVYNDDLSQSRLYELQGEMGEEAFNTFSLLLGRQAKIVWKELGHSDFQLGR